MKFLGKQIIDNKVEVQGIYTDETISINAITEIPVKPADVIGKNTILYMNSVTKFLSYEYVDRELTSEELVLTNLQIENETAKANIASMRETIMALMAAGMPPM